MLAVIDVFEREVVADSSLSALIRAAVPGGVLRIVEGQLGSVPIVRRRRR